MVITKQLLSYREVSEGVTIDHDDFGLAAGLTETRKKAFFSNPNLVDYSQGLLNLIRVDGIVAGRSMSFETKIKIDDTISPALSGSTLDVPEGYRHTGVGADLFYYFSKGTSYRYNICSGISSMALPMYSALKYNIIAFPRMMLLCDVSPLIKAYGIHGLFGKLITTFINLPIKLFNKYHFLKSRALIKKFVVKKEVTIPDWVDEIVLNDCHKYMEVHDKAWLQWNLDNNFKGDVQDIQSFYSISKEGKPLGFFMTKERYREEAGGKLKDFVLGAIVEWGITSGCDSLSETIINKMALSTFTQNVGIIEFATSDIRVCAAMRKWGFVHHGDAHIALRDKKKECKDAKNIDLWRVRYGYADVILT